MNKMLNGEPLNTKWGKANIDRGYYRISTNEKGNEGKQLHRLIAEEYFGDWINDPNDKFDIHHIDGNKLNNCILNLEPLKPNDHGILHNIGNTHSLETMKKMSKANNATGYFRVTKHYTPMCKQGFDWVYQYYVDGKQRQISSVDIEKLKQKVLDKGLEWYIIDEEKAKRIGGI